MNIEDLGDQLIEMHGELQKANRHLEKIAAAANIIYITGFVGLVWIIARNFETPHFFQSIWEYLRRYF